MNSSVTASGVLIFLFIIAFCTACSSPPERVYKQQTQTNDFKVVGYLGSSRLGELERIDLSAITHLNIAFANPDSNGRLQLSGLDNLSTAVKLAHRSGVQVYLSIAGGGISGEMAGDWLNVLQSENRAGFIDQIMDFVTEHDLDGVDVDIEWNLIPTIGDLYTPFVTGLRDVLKGNNKGISTALNVAGLHPSITDESLEAYDFINIMIYDKTGPWRPEKVGQHAPLDYVDEALHYWAVERGISANRLTLGVPFYGHNFDDIGSIHYAELVRLDSANAYRDQVGQIYYNGIPTIRQKAKMAAKSFGGIMIWELSQDTDDQFSLLKTIKETLLTTSKGEESKPAN